MAAPKFEIVQKRIQNPQASAPLIIPILVLCNTADEDIERNIRANSARALQWVKAEKAHDRPAIMVGGGPSAADYLDRIRLIQNQGGVVFAMNGASQWLRKQGVTPDYQVIADAKQITATLVDPLALNHLFASQVHSDTMDAAPSPILWHLGDEQIEAFFPEERRKRGGYVLLGGGASVGNSAMCVAYALGFRYFHVFGYDSCHRGEDSHAYRQPMNDMIPTVEVEWAGKTFTASVAMKAQAEKFQITAQALQQDGCDIRTYGDGLLQHMFTTPASNLTERDKYRRMWAYDDYRAIAPGEYEVDNFINIAKPDGMVLDFGCGTGRAALELNKRGLAVLLIDFADNCRDDEAFGLPFLEWDLTRPNPARAPYGFCCDVMEHIPPVDTETVLTNLFEAAERIYFRIDTQADLCGELIGMPLHLSVRPHAEWRTVMETHGRILFELECPGHSLFYVERY